MALQQLLDDDNLDSDRYAMFSPEERDALELALTILSCIDKMFPLFVLRMKGDS